MLNLIEVEGAHYDMGVQQGQQVSENYHDFFDKVIPTFVHNKVLLNLGTLIFGRRLRKRLRPVLVDNIPEIDDYLLGLVDGLETRKNMIYSLNMVEVIICHPKLIQFLEKSGACTQMLIQSSASRNDNSYLARNYDNQEILRDYQIVRITKPDKGYKTIGITHNIMVGVHQGMNEKGLVIGFNYGRSWKQEFNDYNLYGVPSTMIAQAALERCITLEDAVSFITEFPKRANGAFYGILDEQGNICVVETTASRHAVRYPEDGVLVNTNLYMTDELIDANVPESAKLRTSEIPYYLSPKKRYERAHELIMEMKGKVNRKGLYGVLSDHGGEGPGECTVCVHGKIKSTLATAICIPKKREFWVTDTNPCESKLKKFKL